MVLTFAGVLLFMVFITPGSPVYLLGIFYFVFMMGYSMSFANSMTCALNTLDPEFKADGNAVFNSFNQLSGALGTTLMSALVSTCRQAWPRDAAVPVAGPRQPLVPQ